MTIGRGRHGEKTRTEYCLRVEWWHNYYFRPLVSRIPREFGKKYYYYYYFLLRLFCVLCWWLPST